VSRATTRAGRVYVLLGGAHGFDGEDDDDGSFFQAIIGRFERRLGIESVVRVDICEGRSGEPSPVFPLSKVASFVSTEHARGVLWRAVAGLEALRGDGA